MSKKNVEKPQFPLNLSVTFKQQRQQNKYIYLFNLQTEARFWKMIHKRSYLISAETPPRLGGSLFSSRVWELLLGEHFGEDGLRDTAAIYFRDDIFLSCSVGEVSLLSDVSSYR